MKNSAKYQKRMKKLFSRARKQPPPETEDTVRLMLMGVLEEDVSARKAARAMDVLEDEFVDFNELRVSPVKDIAERLGEDFPGARTKAVVMTEALKAVYQRTNSLSLAYLASKTKREIRNLLREALGLSPYAESVVTLYAFQGHAIPVDNLLLEALKLDEYIHPDSDVADLQGFLERIILNKDAARCHEALRRYAARSVGRVGREMARRRRQAEAEAKARAEAEAKAKAEAEAKVKQAEKARKAAARKAKKKKRVARARTKAASKRTRKPPARRKTRKGK